MAFCCIINGPCSAGKSTLIRSLQNNLPDPNIHLGIDAFHLAIPPRALDLNHPQQHYLAAESEYKNNLRYTTIKHGKYIQQINRARFASVKQFVHAGVNVISDELLWTKADVIQLATGLSGITVYTIGVHVSEEIGSTREKLRFTDPTANVAGGFRPEGMSRASSECVHQHMIYDLEINNDDNDSDDNINGICDYILNNPKPKAFSSLASLMQS